MSTNDTDIVSVAVAGAWLRVYLPSNHAINAAAQVVGDYSGDEWGCCALSYQNCVDAELDVLATYNSNTNQTSLTLTFPDNSEIGQSGKFAIYRNLTTDISYAFVGEYLRDPHFFVCDPSNVGSVPVIDLGLYQSLYEVVYP